MKHSSLKLFTLGTALLIATLSGLADNSRYVTLTMTGSVTSTSTGPSPAFRTLYNYNGTNSFQIAEGEIAEVVSTDSSATVVITILKDGNSIAGKGPSLGNPGTIIVGPAVIVGDGVYSGGQNDNDFRTSMFTLKITPSTYDVNKTLILPPGTNQIYVGMESSTNLVNWSDATNGVYGSPEVARFFRMRQSTLPSQ